ncbi:hypothetical protein C8R47DRAFT_1277231 [Mycena vitilis]|nr:hypothetical protein C8R47DRAFT_1277231 [Mycena vitilis]
MLLLRNLLAAIEATYFPNATIPDPPMSNIIPSFLRAPGPPFAPQTLRIGDTFPLNNKSLWTYTIATAFDRADNGTAISSFPYFNNPFSSSCDVTNITANITFTGGGEVQTTVTPTVFQMTWGPEIAGLDDVIFASLHPTGVEPEEDLEAVKQILYHYFERANGDAVCSVEVTVRPCCNCTKASVTSDANIGVELALMEPPCNTEPARFIALNAAVRNASSPYPSGGGVYGGDYNATDLFNGMAESFRKGYIGSGDLSTLTAPFLNVFHIYYHLVRRDLGIILNNNIYLSPELFNNSITDIAVTAQGSKLPSDSNYYRGQTSNDTLMAQWRDSFSVFNETDRVPVLEYLRPVPRRKPLGSAMTSVFVSTFAMVSTVWTIFSVVARAFVGSSEDSEGVAETEPFDVEAKSSLEEIEPTELTSFTAPYKDSTYNDHRWDILIGEVARLTNVIERIENDLRDVKRNVEEMRQGRE